MMTNNNFTSLAIYKSHFQAETAIKELLQSGFEMKKLSIIGRDYFTDEDVEEHKSSHTCPELSLLGA